MKEQLNISDDLGDADDNIIGRKIAAAQNYIERLLGFKIEDTFGGTDQDVVPPALIEAVSQLAADWYENREATLVGVASQPLPFGVAQIVAEYREYSFG
ncbi:head-tail connector protein [Devosia rhodophyticola]|uniref:Head-tail connector protein n=1 Tax=Devosia rhodophyticola TaxID=3026423 RepID=A0ABY7Z102_9HYPH|nr:head-tail connector protein [Devosia rhodophyticola]WDR07301.1 head-tail connector protein [Devosia rhodophyticola]